VRKPIGDDCEARDTFVSFDTGHAACVVGVDRRALSPISGGARLQRL